MFKKITANTSVNKEISFTFEGAVITAQEGDNLGAILLLNGISTFRRHPVTGKERGPWCMMGACFECLVEIDNVKVQACVTTIEENMIVKQTSITNDIEEVEKND